jgi:hypothetical protein
MCHRVILDVQYGVRSYGNYAFNTIHLMTHPWLAITVDLHRIFGDIPAKNNVYTPYICICMALANPTGWPHQPSCTEITAKKWHEVNHRHQYFCCGVHTHAHTHTRTHTTHTHTHTHIAHTRTHTLAHTPTHTHGHKYEGMAAYTHTHPPTRPLTHPH